MIFFLYGPDTFRSRKKFQELKDKFLKDVDQSSLNLNILEGKKLKINDFQSAISTPPFLARKRMVVVTDLLSSNKDKELQVEMVKSLGKEELMKDLILIFWESEKADKRLSLFKRLNKEKYAQEFDLLIGAELKNWLKSEIKTQSGEFESAAVDRLIELLGSDLWEASSEISKLISYCGNKAVKVKDVNEMVRSKSDDNIFNFVDAIANKNQKLAHKLLTDQLALGSNELYLLAMLIRQFKIMLQVKELGEEQGMSQQQITSELKLHPFVIIKSFAQVRNFSVEKIKDIYRQLLATDLKIKTSYADARTLFDLLLVKIME